MIKISEIASDKSNYSSASYAIKNYKYASCWIISNKHLFTFSSMLMFEFIMFRLLLEQLERVKIGQLEDNAKLAFWINIYNSLVMHVNNLHFGKFIFHFLCGLG